MYIIKKDEYARIGQSLLNIKTRWGNQMKGECLLLFIFDFRVAYAPV